MQSTPTLPESKLSRPIDLRAIKRGDYRLATLGVTASELLRILKALRACNNASRSTARHVTITQASSGFLVSAVAGPISLTTVTQVALPADTFVLTAERGSLIRAARRVSPESRPHLTYGKRFFALSDGARRSHVQPHLPPSTLPRSPSPFATPTAILTHTSAPDLCAVQAFVDRYPNIRPNRSPGRDHSGATKLAPEPLFLPGTRLELTPSELRVASGRAFAFHIAHEPLSLPGCDCAYAFTREVSILLVIAIARAFVASGGQVSVSALLRDELFLRYSFGNTALTVQVTGQVEDDPADVDCIDETEDAE